MYSLEIDYWKRAYLAVLKHSPEKAKELADKYTADFNTRKDVSEFQDFKKAWVTAYFIALGGSWPDKSAEFADQYVSDLKMKLLTKFGSLPTSIPKKIVPEPDEDDEDDDGE